MLQRDSVLFRGWFRVRREVEQIGGFCGSPSYKGLMFVLPDLALGL